MLETPDLRFFGRSEQTHLAYNAVFEFQAQHSRLPANNNEDYQAVLQLVKEINEKNKSSEGLYVEEIDEKVVRNVSSFASN